MSEIKVNSEFVVEITPQLIAKAFWQMDSLQQAEFFKSLAAEVGKTKSAYAFGEMQWCYMRDEIRKDTDASNMYMALSAFAFDFWPQRYEL